MNPLSSACHLEDETVAGPDKKQLPVASIKRRKVISSNHKTLEDLMYQTSFVLFCLVQKISHFS